MHIQLNVAIAYNKKYACFFVCSPIIQMHIRIIYAQNYSCTCTLSSYWKNVVTVACIIINQESVVCHINRVGKGFDDLTRLSSTGLSTG